MQKTIQLLGEAIADGLAQNGYAVADGFLALEEVTAILETDEFKNRKLHFKKAGVGPSQEVQVKESIRGDYIRWIDPAVASPPISVFTRKIDELILLLNQSLFLSLKSSEIHLTAYPAGTVYKRHLDQFRRDDHRKLSTICYLNTGWKESDGGQLRMHLSTGSIDILPVGGRFVCFRSDEIEHEVLPATRERFSITGWLLDRTI